MTPAARPFRAEHVGSLKRPESLQRTRERLLGPPELDRNLAAHDNAGLRAAEDKAIDEVVRLQEAVGLQSITDGEFRRRTWWTDFMLGFDGVAERRGESAIKFKDGTGSRRPLPNVTVTGRLAWRRSVVSGGFRYLKSHTARTPKLTIPAPVDLHYFIGGEAGMDRKAYADPAAFWTDLRDAYRREIAELADAGCRYLQLDDVAFAFLCDPARRAEVGSWGHDPDKLLATYIDAVNQCIAARPADMTVALHICRGNMSGHWGAEGGYDAVAEKMFHGIAVDAFFLEYDTPRAGGFEPLRFVPKTKKVVLGLVSSKSSVLESADVLRHRIDDAARHIALEQLCLSPQCGFSSNYLGNPVSVDDQKRKLELIVEVADKVWGNA
jgi:5-methyltetrahydropteroyltriglutamate--homocysteine methyltransferase